MKYNVTLAFQRNVLNINAGNEKEAYISALNRVLNAPKVECDKLFNEMIQAKMNQSYVKELQ